MSNENYYARFMMLPEYCMTHNFMTIEIYCSCLNKLCLNCVQEHYHENLAYFSIKETVGKFHLEVNEAFKLINEHTEKLRGAKLNDIKELNKESSQRCRERRSNLINALSGLGLKIRSIIHTRYFITYDSIMEFKKGNFLQKIVDLVFNYYRKESHLNKKSIDKLIKKKITETEKNEGDANIIFRNKVNNGEEKIKIDLSRSSLTISNIKLSSMNKLMSNNIFDSNKENVDPLRVKASSFTINHFGGEAKVLEVKTASQFFFDPDNDNYEIHPVNENDPFVTKTPYKIASSIRQKYPKVKINSTFFKNEALQYNFNYDTAQTNFLDSGSKNTELSESAKIVCITCRDKFTIFRDQTSWRTRCDVCTKNYEF